MNTLPHEKRCAAIRCLVDRCFTFFYRNFVRIHQTLRMTPALKAGIANHRWTIEETVDLLPEVIRPRMGDRIETDPLPTFRRQGRQGFLDLTARHPTPLRVDHALPAVRLYSESIKRRG